MSVWGSSTHHASLTLRALRFIRFVHGQERRLDLNVTRGGGFSFVIRLMACAWRLDCPGSGPSGRNPLAPAVDVPVGRPRSVCYPFGMRSVEARYDHGTLTLAQPLPLTPGERVRVIVVRQSDPKRWNLAKLSAADASEDLALAEAGLSDWHRDLDGESSD